MILTSYESPIPSSMPRRSNHDTGCWEREGTATLGRVAVASGLWSAAADIIFSDQTGESKDKFMKRCLTTVRSLLLQQLHRDPFHYTPGETTTTQLRAKTGSFIEVQNRKCPALNCHDSS